MRLVDADELILHLNDFMLQQSPIDVQDIESINVSEVIKDCIKAVDEQPTAYDVDKVVEQLEEKELNCLKKDVITSNKRYRHMAYAFRQAIGVVKGGGDDGIRE